MTGAGVAAAAGCMAAAGRTLILFDIDDTLLDHGTATRRAATLLHDRVGSTLPVDLFCDRWAGAIERHYARYLAGEVSYEGQHRDRVREVVDAGLSDQAADAIIGRYLVEYDACWCLFTDALPCLERMSGYRLGIVSNGPGELQRRKLARMGLADRFEHVVISEEASSAKPDPAIFHRACELFGVAPGDAVHVGDRYDLDAEGARAAGLHGVWLDRKGRGTDAHHPPRIESLGELARAVAGGDQGGMARAARAVSAGSP